MWAGLAFGVAQIFYMIGLFAPKWAKGEMPSVEPITVTTDLGKMYRGMEVFLCKTLGIADTGLYGSSVVLANGNWIPTAEGAFVPGVGWPIVGMMLGGLLVAMFEKESRGWAKYDWKVLLIAFFGGALFSYGTRLAGGCTLNHLLGGIPMMNIHSMVAVVFMSLGGMMGFFLMGFADSSKYFKHQETLDYAKESYKKGNMTDCVCYDPNYKPNRDVIRWFGILFSVIFFGVGIVGGLFNPEMFQYAKDAIHLDALKPFGKSIDHQGLAYVALTLAAGILGGFGMAKSGFGTECGLLTAEAHHFVTKNDKVMTNFMKMPQVTKTLFRGMMPLVGISAMWVLVTAFVIITWGFLDYKHGFTGDIKYALTGGVPIGGFILGMGAVLLIGCEIRSYMRIGLGYTNTMVGFAGFAVGYLPFTLNYKEHMAFFYATDWLGTEAAKKAGEDGLYFFPQLFSDNHWVQVGVAIVWFIFLVKLFTWSLKKGARALGTTTDVVANMNTEDVHRMTYIDESFEKTAERLGLDEYKHYSGFDNWMNETFGKERK